MDVSGFLVDRFCWDDNTASGSPPFTALDSKIKLNVEPINHTLHCMRDPPVCRDSGFLLVNQADGDALYTSSHEFDAAGNKVVLALLDATKEADPGTDWKTIGATVSGSVAPDNLHLELDFENNTYFAGEFYLVDKFCWEDNTASGSPAFTALDTKSMLNKAPETHTLHCMRDPDLCRNSGFLLLSKPEGASEYSEKYAFDDAGNTKVLTLLDATKGDDATTPWKVAGSKVRVSGTVSGGVVTVDALDWVDASLLKVPDDNTDDDDKKDDDNEDDRSPANTFAPTLTVAGATALVLFSLL